MNPKEIKNSEIEPICNIEVKKVWIIPNLEAISQNTICSGSNAMLPESIAQSAHKYAS